LVRSQQRFDSSCEHHASLAQLVGGVSLRRRTVQVRILRGAPIHPRSPMAEAARSKRVRGRFASGRGYQSRWLIAETSTLLSPSGQGIGPTHRHSGVRVPAGAPTRTCSSVAEQSPDKRSMLVRFQTGARIEGDRHEARSKTQLRMCDRSGDRPGLLILIAREAQHRGFESHHILHRPVTRAAKGAAS
jgi:hypothetical protein